MGICDFLHRREELVLPQVLRYNKGSAIRPKNSRQDQFWDIIHGQEGDGEGQEALPRKKGVHLCGTQPPKNLHSQISGSQSGSHFYTESLCH